MSRKKLKGFDPGNNNKARRSAWEALQDGKTQYNQAPRPHADSNRLTGAARKFATQLLISKKLDERDRERERAEQEAKGGGVRKPRGNATTTNFLPDYKQALQAQIAATAERAAKKLAKDERRRIAREGGGSVPGAESASANPQAAVSTPAAPASATSTPRAPLPAGAVSLSKSLEQQRQSRKDREADLAKRNIEAEKAAALAGEAAAAQAKASAAAAADDAGAAAAAAPVTFTTEMRPGESFRSFQARLVREKAEKMQGDVAKAKKLSEKKKRKLSERDEKKKAKKDPSLDPREERFQAERAAKDAADAARVAARWGHTAADTAGNDADEEGASRSAKRARKATATEFSTEAPVGFGEVAERPPQLSVVPKSKALSAEISHDRILDSLLLMQEGKAAKRGGLKGLSDEARAEWISKQRDKLSREAAAERAKQAQVQSLREASVAAYKAAKLKRRAADEEAKLAGTANADKDKPYVKKSVLKKQRRNRERLQQFKDAAELDLDMEIEAAGGFDD